ncbi:uncharacterized protein LOC121993161 [Zingiber officinale]|uniref:Myb-like domain-containing protein n=1 Tax=Zingiber officinale TaxID=94328 RepID=A0A8J5GC13_ZINOF|nr:uncharacterized protein LOC121993161 [Zingiber officinale]KAG6496622.1 hypothetical protein ZIOFF_044492 [Zingiber officinale]
MVFNHVDACFLNQFAHVDGRHLSCDNQITQPFEHSLYGVAASEELASGNNTREVVLSDKDKRRISEDESCLQANKRSKQADQDLQSSSFEEICPSTAQQPSPGVLEDEKDHQVVVGAEEFATEAKSSHWFAQDSPIRPPFCPGSSGYGSRASEFDHCEEICLPVYYGFIRKRVAIGGNHQADIPVWRPYEFKNQSRDSANCASQWTSVTISSCDNLEIVSNKWLGTRVTPMPESSLLASDDVTLHRKMDCSCIDDGSIRCVRQHVSRAREMIKQDVGLERFGELGFGNMGEIVAQRWTEREEQLFEEIVSSNFVSLGKNFWNKMPVFFPDKSSKELVSYYFNVFMLRRRAVQNRLDPLHIDSDNEELQESEDGEFVSEEDSDVESPVADESVVDEEEEDLNEMETVEEIDGAENCHNYELALYDDEKCSCGDESTLVSGTQFPGSKLPSSGDYDIQDESCTSFEGQHNGTSFMDLPSMDPFPRGRIKDDDMNLIYKNDQNDGFLDEHCNLQAWDMSYSSGGSEKDGLLSTVNVIEEVFGKDECEK